MKGRPGDYLSLPLAMVGINRYHACVVVEVRMFEHRRIKAILVLRGVSLTDFAALRVVSYQTLSAWRSGLKRPKIETLERVALALGVPVGVLTSDDAWPVNEEGE